MPRKAVIITQINLTFSWLLPTKCETKKTLDHNFLASARAILYYCIITEYIMMKFDSMRDLAILQCLM